MPARLHYEQNELADICQRYGIVELSLYGSVLRDDFDPKRSDIDVLVAFKEEADKSLFTLVDIQDALTQLFDRQAHLCTRGSISRYFREEVLREAEVQYVAA